MESSYPPREKQSTYVVQDRNSAKELARLRIQDQMITSHMGGVLPEQPNPTAYTRLLDIGSGSGSWAIEAAQSFPHLSVVGIDISRRMVEYAQEQAKEARVADRVTFRVMDALQAIEFPDNSFDLVNIRLGSSFVRTFEWPKLIQEMLLVVCPGGVVRVVEARVGGETSSPALQRYFEMSTCALYESMRFFEPQSDGLTRHLPEIVALQGRGCEDIHTHTTLLTFRANTPEGQDYVQDMVLAMQTTRPFLQKYGCLSQDYETISQQAREETQHPDFYATWPFVTVWGRKPGDDTP